MGAVADECVRPGLTASKISFEFFQDEFAHFLHRRLPRLYFHITGMLKTSEGKFWVTKMPEDEIKALLEFLEDGIKPPSPRYVREERNEAAAKMQSIIRRRKAKFLVVAMKNARLTAAIRMQSRWRGRTEREKYHAIVDHRNHMATQIQKVARGRIARNEVEIMRMELEEDAAAGEGGDDGVEAAGPGSAAPPPTKSVKKIPKDLPPPKKKGKKGGKKVSKR